MDFSNQVDEMGENLSLSVGNTIEFGYKIIHNYLIKKRWIFFNCLLTAMSNLGGGYRCHLITLSFLIL